MKKEKTGAASFYVVAFSTLILVVLASSFAAAIMAEIARSSNDDLAQSAYDSAMAGIEDAKTAFSNYHNCVNSGAVAFESDAMLRDDLPQVTCEDIIYWVNHPDEDSDKYHNCDMVAHILGRIGKTESGEVPIRENVKDNENAEVDNGMDQAYTCAKFETKLDDYRATLTSMNPYKIVKVNFAYADADKIKKVRLSWQQIDNDTKLTFTNATTNGLTLQPLASKEASVPPMLAVTLLQSSYDGNIQEISNKVMIGNNRTDRATMYFVPTNEMSVAMEKNLSPTDNTAYRGLYDGSDNVISKSLIASTNDHAKDYPFAVYCDTSKEYACSVTLELPDPADGTGHRDDKTFMFIIQMPYEKPDTDFSIEYFCGSASENCRGDTVINENSAIAKIADAQVLIDSTGRANDLFRRIETRLEPTDNVFDYPYYAVQVGSLEKDLTVTSEYGDYTRYYIDIDPLVDEEPTPPTPPTPTPKCGNVPEMQNWTSTLANVGDSITLCDIRDTQTYTVAKIADGKVWMTKNLDLAGGTTLSSADTNISGSYTLPNSSVIGFVDDYTAYVYNSGSTTCSSTRACYSYYSYPAATAGVNPSSGNASGDICPAGWRLPTSNEYATLFSHYQNGNLLNATPWTGVYNGMFSSGGTSFFYGGTQGWYWSSTAENAVNADYIHYYNTGTFIVKDDLSGKSIGAAVRCILK
jgi:uncharacterized protein (TIGR02145 family)